MSNGIAAVRFVSADRPSSPRQSEESHEALPVGKAMDLGDKKKLTKVVQISETSEAPPPTPLQLKNPVGGSLAKV